MACINKFYSVIKRNQNYVIFRETNGTEDYYMKWNNTGSERQICFLSYTGYRFLEGIKEGRNQTILEEEEDKSERRMRHEYGVVFKVHYICAQKCNTDVYICIINTC